MPKVIAVVIRGYSGMGAGAKLITFLPYRHTSHVSLVYYFEGGIPPVEYEAIQFKGVVHHQPTKGEKFKAYKPKLSQEQMTASYEEAKAAKGGYDWRAIFAFVIKIVKPSQENWMCAELVADNMNRIGNRLSKREPHMETPTFVVDSNQAGPESVEYEYSN